MMCDGGSVEWIVNIVMPSCHHSVSKATALLVNVLTEPYRSCICMEVHRSPCCSVHYAELASLYYWWTLLPFQCPCQCNVRECVCVFNCRTFSPTRLQAKQVSSLTRIISSAPTLFYTR